MYANEYVYAYSFMNIYSHYILTYTYTHTYNNAYQLYTRYVIILSPIYTL